VKQTRLRSQLTSALQSEGASPIDSQAPSPRPESPRGPHKGKEKEFEESGGGDGKLASQAAAARRPTRPSPKKKAAPQESLWQKMKGWYAAAKRMLVPLLREYSAAAMERTVVLLEWLAEKHLEKGTHTLPSHPHTHTSHTLLMHMWTTDVHAKLKERGLDETILFANDYRHHLRRQDSAAAGAEEEEEADSDSDDSSSSATDGGSSSSDDEESSTSSASSSCDSSDSECASEGEAAPPTQAETEMSAQSEELLAAAAKAGVTFDSSADAGEDFPADDDTSAVVHNSARWWRQQLGRAYNSWVKWVSTNTNIICYLALVVNHAGTITAFVVVIVIVVADLSRVVLCRVPAAYASVLSVVYPVSLFIYAALAAPRPTKTYWRLVLAYSSVVVCVKFLFQLSFLCVCYTASGEEYAVQPTCELETCRFEQVPTEFEQSHDHARTTFFECLTRVRVLRRYRHRPTIRSWV
jgi:hypothetical protein